MKADVSVTFDGEEEVTIAPEYVRANVHYEYKELILSEKLLQEQLKDIYASSYVASLLSLNQHSKIDKRWCKLRIQIENTGSTVIKTPKQIVVFRDEEIEDIDDRFYYCNSWGINDALKAQTNASRDAKREVFHVYNKGVEYRPKEIPLVQKDNRVFSISIIPRGGVRTLPLMWRFLCEDYHMDGVLTIKVTPRIEDCKK